MYDGKTSDPFEQPVTKGRSYLLQLIHQIDVSFFFFFNLLLLYTCATKLSFLCRSQILGLPNFLVVTMSPS